MPGPTRAFVAGCSARVVDKADRNHWPIRMRQMSELPRRIRSVTRPGKFMRPKHGFPGCTPGSIALTPVFGAVGPRRAGSGLREGTPEVLDVPGIPRDARGIVLLCGFAAAAVLGIAAILVGDPIGIGFIGIALVGYYFNQTRLVPFVLWLVVAAYGALGALAGNAVDWIEFVTGLTLAGVSLAPVRSPGQLTPSVHVDAQPQGSSNGRTSAFDDVA